MNQKGFTLIELILVVVLLGIVGIAMTSAFVPTMTVSVNIDERKEAFQQGRTAMERMMREIREARAFTSVTIPPTVGSTQITFTTHRAQTPIPAPPTPPVNETIQYSWDRNTANAIQRNAIDMTDCATCTQSLTLTFFDRNGAVLAAPVTLNAIWRVQADIQMTVGNQTIELRSEANPRG